jgi:poly(rC)-binding protein 3/4
MRPAGKRPRQQRDNNREERREQHKRPFSHPQESLNNDELVLYRIICPGTVIGSVIGKNGNVINSIRKHTNARVQVVDPYPGSEKRVILVYCHVKHRDLNAAEGGDSEPVCAAQDALLRLHQAILDAQDMLHMKHTDPDKKNTKEANIIVPSSQAANIIGKSGVVIKRLRSTSRAFIKVIPKDPSDMAHACAMSFDNFVQVNLPNIMT